jgi:hypothetical protein
MSRPQDLSTTERALQLARSGTFASLTDISRQLNREGYTMVESHLRGSSIRAQLNKLLKERKAEGHDQ